MKKKIKEAIVVEGRDDADVVSRAYDTLIIATHGFGIRSETWQLMEKAYREKGLIVLTDPDHAGEEIRKRILERFPQALQAYMPRAAATAGDDIGVENATPDDVTEAIEKAHSTSETDSAGAIGPEDLYRCGLSGGADSAAERERVGAILGIGYGNAKTFIKKLNAFGIKKEELFKAVGAGEKENREQK
jgi:ribonuclease M5